MSHNYRGIPLDLARNVLPQHAREYAKSRGWKRVDTKRSGIAVYSAPGIGRYEEVVVPSEPLMEDYPRRIVDSILNIAEIEARGALDVLEDLMQPEADTLRFAIEDRESQEGTISLVSGLDLVEGVKRSLLAAACSAVEPTLRFHPRLSRTESDQLVRASRLKPIERGSFVVAVSCPLRAVEAGKPLLDGMDTFTRRTINLLMQSILQIVNAVERDTISDLYTQTAGPFVISANLCEALLRMRPVQGGILRVAASWAPTLPQKSTEIPSVVRIREEYFDPISDVYDRLRPKEGPKPGLYVGTVEVLNGSLGENGLRSGEVTMQILLDDELATARLDLNAEQYRLADAAHMQGGVVAVVGKLQRGRRVHHIIEISQFGQVDRTQ